MKALVAVSLILLVCLQYSLWFGQSGHFAQARMRDQLEQQQLRVDLLRQRNRILAAEVLALKKDSSVLEARARRDLGMVNRGEVFYLIPDADL